MLLLVEMGSFYLDIIKDRRYTAKADSVARRSCQTALYHIAGAGSLDGAVMSFTAGEIWGCRREKYVFTGEWYDGFIWLEEE